MCVCVCVDGLLSVLSVAVVTSRGQNVGLGLVRRQSCRFRTSIASLEAMGGSKLAMVLQCCTFMSILWRAEAAVCVPERGCDTAYAYYKAQANDTLEFIGAKFQTTAENLLAVNPSVNPIDGHRVLGTSQPLYIPFPCECIQGQLLHLFNYQVERTDTVEFIASTVYEDLTRGNWIGSWSALPDINFILTGATLKIPVQCFCGNPSASPEYGLFLTYPVAAGAGANSSGLASDFNVSEALLKEYNPHVFWDDSHPEQYAFVPVKDESGKYPPYSPGSSNAGEVTWWAGVFLGAATGVGGGLAFLSVVALALHCFGVEQRRRQQMKQIASKLKDVDDPIRKF